jgi:hypothetical protein
MSEEKERLDRLEAKCETLAKEVGTYRMLRVWGIALLLSLVVVIACAFVWAYLRLHLPSCTLLDLAAFAMMLLAGVTVSGLVSFFALRWAELG